MDEWFEVNKLIYELPNILVRGVEDMRSVLMHENALLLLAVDISASMVAPINNKHSLTRLMGTISYHGTIQSGTDNQQIIFECKIQNVKFKIKSFYTNANLANFRPLKKSRDAKC